MPHLVNLLVDQRHIQVLRLGCQLLQLIQQLHIGRGGQERLVSRCGSKGGSSVPGAAGRAAAQAAAEARLSATIQP